MGLKVSSTIKQSKIESPAVVTKMAIESMNAFRLRELNPFDFDTKEKKYLFYRFYESLDDFSIYFFEDNINEKFGFPEHLRTIGRQLIAYEEYNLVIAPREFSKSTLISTIFPIREICYRKKKYIVIVSETNDLAGDFVEGIRNTFDTNEKVRLFYGDFQSKKLIDPDQGYESNTEKWTTSDIICQSKWNNKLFFTRVRGRGAGQQIRGKSFRLQRPDLIVFDDIESRKNTDTEHQRKKLKLWFNRDSLPAKAYYDEDTGEGQIVVAGTIVHKESKLNELVKSVKGLIKVGKVPLWNMQFYKAADSPKTLENPIWPEKWGKEELDKVKQLAIENGDYPGFVQERFNEPIADEDRKFKLEYFEKRYDQVVIENYYGILTLLYEGKRYPCSLSAGLDLGGWRSQKSDFTSIVVLANIWNVGLAMNEGFVLEVFNERWTPDEIIDNIFSISNRYNFKDIYNVGTSKKIPWTVETNAFQTLLYFFLGQEMKRRNDFSVNIVHEDHESQDKDGRILSMVPAFRSRYYKFANYMQWVVNRFSDYGTSPDMHDDVEDAFEKAHRNLKRLSLSDARTLQELPCHFEKVVEPDAISSEGNWMVG